MEDGLRRSNAGVNATERQRRERAVRNAVTSAEMEGGSVSDEIMAVYEQFAEGEIDLEEMSDRVRAMRGPSV